MDFEDLFAAEDIGVFTVGSDKYKLEVVTYDTVYDPGKTVAAMNRAVYNDGVKYGVIIGAGVHPPILPIIRETGFLDLAFAAAGPDTGTIAPILRGFWAWADGGNPRTTLRATTANRVRMRWGRVMAFSLRIRKPRSDRS